MSNIAYIAYGFGHLILFVWAVRLYARYRHSATVPLILLAAGLVYDNALLGFGSLMGHGELLRTLSIPRFVLHALLTPLLIPAGLALARRAGVRWAYSRPITALLVGTTVAMIALGIYGDILQLRLERQTAGGIVSYGNADGLSLPIPALVTVAVLIVTGAAVWRKRGWPWMCMSAVAEVVAASAGGLLVVAGNLGELILIAGMVATDARFSDGAD